MLDIAVMAQHGDTSHFDYLIAIEVIHVASRDSLEKHHLHHNRVSADEVLQNIKNKLSISSHDDEIRIIQSNIVIGLRDPFSQAKMCDIPVRGKACPHNDCFDFDVFLRSRPRKGDASVADQWKCPICGSDARPHMLLFDGFIDNVRKQLEAQGLADTRQIVVQQDGSWAPKADPKADAKDGVPVRGDAHGPSGSDFACLSIPAEVEVIDLSN